jgi:hypothetical protein
VQSLDLTYSLRRIRSARQDPVLLAQALSVYQANTPHLEMASTNEIQYWADHYNSEFDDDLFLFALQINGATIGFAQCVRFLDENFTVLDYMTVAKEHKTVGVFLLFYEQICAFFRAGRTESDYVVAEILLNPNGEFTDSSEFWRGVMALERFRVIDAEYHQLQLGRTKFETELPAKLMISASDEVKTLRRDTYLLVVEAIFFKHYLRWYKPFQKQGEAAEYRAKAQKNYDGIRASLSNERLSLSPLPGISLPTGTLQSSYRANKGLIVFETLSYILLLILLVSGKVFLNLGATEILVLAVGALLVRMALLSVFVPEARRSLEVSLDALGQLLGKKNSVARKRTQRPSDES